ncbi:hypothetical protein OKW32_000602 [Paraburkholderia youngii]
MASRFPAVVISCAVRWYFRFSLSLRDVEELLLERGVAVTYETIRCWCEKFGARFARRAKAARPKPGGTWHLGEMFVTLGCERYLLWRAVDEHGAELDVLVRKAGRTAGRPVERCVRALRIRDPRVRRGARFHAGYTPFQRGEIPKYIRASELLAYDDLALRIHCVNLQHALGQVQSNSRYVHDERSFAVDVTTSPLWHQLLAA